MIDPKLLLKDFETSVYKLSRRGISREEVSRVQRLILQKNERLEKVEQLRREKKLLSQSAFQTHKATKNSSSPPHQQTPDKVQEIKDQVKTLKQDLEMEEKTLIYLTQKLEAQLLQLPNFPDDKAPDGMSSADNVEVLRENSSQALLSDKSIPPHWEIMEQLDIFDQKRAAKIAGSGFSVLKGRGAKLLRALITMAFDIFEEDYSEFAVPSLVNSKSLEGTGHLPKFSEEAYWIKKDDLWAIPTGEVPLTALHSNEILDPKHFPLKYMTATHCFRREAGSAGMETRGLQRLHEFNKLELVKICRAESSAKELQSLLQDALKPIRLLKLPFRVIDLCSKDLGWSAARTYDIEVYSPGTQSWLEVSSVSCFTDYQSRRSKIRFREEKRKENREEKQEKKQKIKQAGKQTTTYPHTLNGSGLAIPRVMAGILENGWEQNEKQKGKVQLPSALVKYTGFEYL